MSDSLRLVLTMLHVAAVDGPSLYGSVSHAIEEIERALKNGAETIPLDKVDSILRENNVDTREIEAAYVRKQQ